MDKNNYANVLAHAESEEAIKKVKLLLEISEGSPKEVPDPYYGGENGFEKVFHMIDEACTKIAHDLNEQD